jgi:radical SAM protein with 4Fe4S-binding SPASM domain
MTPEGNQMFETFASSDNKYDSRTRGSVTGCPAPNDRVAVDWDGEVYPCCNPSGLHIYSCGNINTQTFSEIWHGQKYEYVRRFCIKGDIEHNGLAIPCYSCFGKYPDQEMKHNDPYAKFIKE